MRACEAALDHPVQVLGFGDFYYELAVQIVEACLATRNINGGLMDMRSLLRYVAVIQIACPVQGSACSLLVFRCPWGHVHGGRLPSDVLATLRKYVPCREALCRAG